MVWESVAKVDEDKKEKPSAGWSTVATVDDEPVVQDESVVQGLKHALKGYPKMALGMAELPSMIGNAATYGQRNILNRAGVPEEVTDKVKMPYLAEQEFMQPVMETLENTEGVSPGSWADFAQTFVEWGGLGPFSAVRKGASVLPDLGAGLGAMAGDYFADEIGEVGGGILGTVLGLVRRRGTDIPTTAEKVAVNVIQENAADPKGLARAVEASKEDAGTFADRTGDAGVYNIEAGVRANINAAEEARYNEIEADRDQQVMDSVRDQFNPQGADPDLAKAKADQSLKATKRTIEGAIDRKTQEIQSTKERTIQEGSDSLLPVQEQILASNTARLDAQKIAEEAAQRAEEAIAARNKAIDEFSSDETLADASITARNAYEEARATNKLLVEEIWKPFDEVVSTPFAPYKNIVKEWAESLPPAKRNAIEKNAAIAGPKGILAPFRLKNISEMKPKEIQNWIKAINDEKSIPTGGKFSENEHGALGSLYDALRAKLEADFPAYKEGMEASARFEARFPQQLQEAAAKEPEEFFKVLGESDESGAVAIRLLNKADIPGMPEAVTKRLKALARRYKDGLPDDKFNLEFESIMESLPPEVQRQAMAIVEKGNAAEAAEAASEAARKSSGIAEIDAEKAAAQLGTERFGLEKAKRKIEEDAFKEIADAEKSGEALKRSVQSSELAKWAKGRESYIRKVLKNPDDMAGFEKLKQQINSLGVDAQESFKADIGRIIIEKLQSTGKQSAFKRSIGEAQPVDVSAVEKFNNMTRSLRESGILSEREITKMRESLNRLSSHGYRMNSKADYKQAFENQKFLSDLFTSGISALSLKLLPGSSLVMAGAVRRAVKAFLQPGGKNDSETMQALNDIMLNPDSYAEIMAKMDNQADMQQAVLTKLNSFAQSNQAVQSEDQ